MARWHNYYLDNHAHMVTATVQRWRPLLGGDAVSALYREWDAARAQLGVAVLAYCIMPEHFHTILWSERGGNVQAFVRRTLSLTARAFPGEGRFWKERPRVLPIYSGRVLETKIDYIHANPIRRGLVGDPAGWANSSFRQLVLGASDPPFTCDGWDVVRL